jgi:hypothetical protein
LPDARRKILIFEIMPTFLFKKTTQREGRGRICGAPYTQPAAGANNVIFALLRIICSCEHLAKLRLGVFYIAMTEQ